MAGVGELRVLAARCDEPVPLELLRFVDAGGHPDAYVRAAFEGAMRDNQAAKGRVAAIAALRANVAREAAARLPAYAEAFR
jgi:hypothetical protein